MGSSSSNPIKPQPKPLAFHRLQGENAQVSPDWQRAKRLRGFEHAITLSDRPLTLNRYIDIRVLETSPAWRGAMRIGVTAQHPGNLTRKDLPSCACPGLSERDKFWAAPVPEERATLGSELYVYVTTQGDVMCGTTACGKRRAWEEDCILGGVPTGGPLWLVVDVYGQTMEVEMFEPKAALTIVTNSPDGGAAQRAAAKVRGSEDPITENSINTTLLQQQEDGQGTSTGTTTTQGPTTPTPTTAPATEETFHPPPSIQGSLNAETPKEEKQPEVSKEAEPKVESKQEDPPTSATYDDAVDEVAPSVEKGEENAAGSEVAPPKPKATLPIMTNSPDSGAAQQSAEERESEDPITENSINTTLLEQREDGQGTSTGTTITQGSTAPSAPTTPTTDETSPPPPSIHGSPNAEEEKQMSKEVELEVESKQEDPPMPVTNDDAVDEVAPSVEKGEENAVGIEVTPLS